MARKLAVAQVVKPQGIKGEVKLKSLGDDAYGLTEVDEVYLSENSEKSVKVTKVWIYKDNAFMALEGVTDRNQAETLRGKTLYVKMPKEYELEEGQYFVADLIGCAITDESGKKLGTLKDIMQHGAADVYVVEGERNFMMPSLKKVIMHTDIKAKTITVDAKVLSEVAVYED
jgi:16S rRNA processing protein RimM